jgi:ubiquinone/menaquinone biosynthesis C-methylase UbiE
VRGVFSSVASKYDVMNAMSFGIHRIWKMRWIGWRRVQGKAVGCGGAQAMWRSGSETRQSRSCDGVGPDRTDVDQRRKRLK